MTHGFNDLDNLLIGFLAKLEPKAIAQVNRVIASSLRQSQSRRIGEQKNPDGSTYEARKVRQKKGRIRTGAMFKKIKTAKYLKHASNASEVTIYFNRKVRRIAKSHQFGDTEQFGGRNIPMPKRELLGLTEQEEKDILDAVIQHLATL